MCADDLALLGCSTLEWCGALYPYARILSINTEEARKVPGAHLVLTGTDVANIRFGRAVYDVPILAVEKVRFTGEMVVAVAAESAAIAKRPRRWWTYNMTPYPRSSTLWRPSAWALGRPRGAMVLRWCSSRP